MKSKFTEFGLGGALVDVLEKKEITVPTEVQEKSIPHALAGYDVIGHAQTGTGKTLAFLLPIFENTDENAYDVQSLIVAPTRELAIQITAEARMLASAKHLNILSAYGGQDIGSQIKKMKGKIQMVIGTPGRILDHMRRGNITLEGLKFLVLDEADQMLHMGFLPDIEAIIRRTSEERQTLCFSATMPKGVRSLAGRFMKNPKHVSVEPEKVTIDKIDQVVIETTDRGKQDALCKVLEEENVFMGIIFCRTKRRVSALITALIQKGYNCGELHGDLSQAKREKVMRDFRSMKLQYLIATDVAARGLDIEGVTHVFNYDIPEDTESYIHRIGRTGRAGESGRAFTFITPKNKDELTAIEKAINMKLCKRKFAKHDTERVIDNGKGNEKDRKTTMERDWRRGHKSVRGAQQADKGRARRYKKK